MDTPPPGSSSRCCHFPESVFLTQLADWTSTHFHSDPRKWPDYVMLGIKSHTEVGAGDEFGCDGAMAKEP